MLIPRSVVTPSSLSLTKFRANQPVKNAPVRNGVKAGYCRISVGQKEPQTKGTTASLQRADIDSIFVYPKQTLTTVRPKMIMLRPCDETMTKMA